MVIEPCSLDRARESRMQWCRYMGEDDVLCLGVNYHRVLQYSFEVDFVLIHVCVYGLQCRRLLSWIPPNTTTKKLKSIFVNLVKGVQFSKAY